MGRKLGVDVAFENVELNFEKDREALKSKFTRRFGQMYEKISSNT